MVCIIQFRLIEHSDVYLVKLNVSTDPITSNYHEGCIMSTNRQRLLILLHSFVHGGELQLSC